MGALVEYMTKMYTEEEYLAMEEKSVVKHHFINGQIIEMPGATYRHNLISTNIVTALNIALEAKNLDYAVLNSDLKVFIPRTVSFVYPDAVVICEAPLYYKNREDILLNPLLIVEVLSPSTEEHDRTGKFFEYKQISSFKEYVLIEQNNPFITASFKIGDGLWQDIEAAGIDATIYSKSIDCTLDLKKIYRGVKF